MNCKIGDEKKLSRLKNDKILSCVPCIFKIPSTANNNMAYNIFISISCVPYIFKIHSIDNNNMDYNIFIDMDFKTESDYI